ncbi:similar to Saccharomyces cerevisiae YHR171W ATG7 Autophagy-related protein and dual specificity member of the E1 family of ubiquitin- activating enzymes [Maudiozyma barnettii]|uniref:Ubiquitin-like modifier-activating enzyme ATG7 n=1 Tax=Maudiozyma barnettii TaxID=61262 RepID=A0A8H2VG05_9SACH|nr:Atg7p [Kazachstania barnettii]CAB4254870.1 similar to Saccharomyces cerevisiae YHR171W ATG7 Autophagy-related protein and dual specificity member of the E1 family of ubiquitin- activating enzymes [Kazachstania barnettii]CAD1783101.1 similar to Saccharomyces cerevisiae YHR171W ATG7 Autophagy-related protein and dual specificity member of the E1 family of ubiquitin- activating enzymes [Kazachstania barnettii]
MSKYVAPLQSFIDTTFFKEFSDIKLNVAQLNVDSIPLYARIDIQSTLQSSNKSHLFLSKQCFKESNWEQDEGGIPIKGAIYNFNVLEQFKNLDKMAFLNERGKELFEQGVNDINKCVSFSIISFADLKKYKFYYWVCVPSFSLVGLNIHTNGDAITTVDHCDDIKEWFSKHMDQWVCVIDNDSTIQPYSSITWKDSNILCLRDLSNMEGVPSTLTKNFLTIYKTLNPLAETVTVYFIRPYDKSFGQKYNLQQTSEIEGDADLLKVTGWERSTQGKLAPRLMDLSSLIDPLVIAEQSVDLNLKLMKWRVSPEIDLDIIKNTKVLILGAGTLGCYVSRALLAWGVRNITLVDNGTVSYSNPVRQPLFEFSDCGKPKAETAAKALKKIFPLVNAKGISLSIPMIGHSVLDEISERQDYETLVNLFKSHDAIFLLMDSRETRWLPTILGNIHHKIIINAALGFDSYLVMRHGNYHGKVKQRLGCYFCQDVVVPRDSLTDKTLDQMCTVTRPGIAMLAASQAVELLVSLLHSKNGVDASAQEETILGEIPHQIRGFLHSFNSVKLKTPAYEYCSACSEKIIETYRTDQWEFVKQSLNDVDYIDTLSGLRQVKMEIDNLEKEMDNWILDDSEIEEI